MPNCSEATCQGNGVITVSPRHCPKVQKPTCANGYPAVQVTDHDGCCPHYQCQCECAGGVQWLHGPGLGRAGAEEAERNWAGPREDTPGSRLSLNRGAVRHPAWARSPRATQGRGGGGSLVHFRRLLDRVLCGASAWALAARWSPAPLGVGPRVPGAGGGGAARKALTPHAGVCSGWGDPHYITFDGTYYTFLDNCTYVLLRQIVPVFGHFRVLVENYFCDAKDGLSCPQSIIVEYHDNRVMLTRKPVHGVMTNEVGMRQGGPHKCQAG